MEENGLRPAQVKQVRGFAAQQLRKKDDPENANNRRVSVIVQYLEGKPEAKEAAKPDKHAK
jgi:flagellar motor protein MotB